MARTNLENIIPIYRIGDGYVIAKDGSVNVGFILTLPEYDSLSKAVSYTHLDVYKRQHQECFRAVRAEKT